jgi:signal transduction histidine kinase
MFFASARWVHTEGFRIAAIFVAIFALSMAALAGTLLVVMDRQFNDQIVQFARADIAAVESGYSMEGEAEAREVIAQRMAAPGASDFFLLERNGKKLAGNLDPMPPRTGILTLPWPQAGPDHAILGVATMIVPGLYVFSGSDVYRSRQARNSILGILGWIFSAAFLLSILGGVLVSRSLLSRTDAIARTCRAIVEGDLKTRVPLRGTQDELDRLSQTINSMLDRIAALMENIRQVTNDIAHDLRTPLTHLRHRLEHARSGSPADYDKALESAIADTDGVLALFAALLRIAQIEGGARRAGFAPVDLAALLRQLRDMFAPVCDDAGHELTLHIAQSATIHGDRELIVQLFSNLIENAIVHTPPGTAIEVALETHQDQAVISVSDNGPGVPQDEQQKLFRPFYRREASRSRPGYGLGLALVHAIAELHGSKVNIGSRAAGGFCISLYFPLVAQAKDVSLFSL